LRKIAYGPECPPEQTLALRSDDGVALFDAEKAEENSGIDGRK